MAEQKVPLETLYVMRDREKALSRIRLNDYLPEAVRNRSREYYEAIEELICWRLEHLPAPPESEDMALFGKDGIKVEGTIS